MSEKSIGSVYDLYNRYCVAPSPSDAVGDGFQLTSPYPLPFWIFRLSGAAGGTESRHAIVGRRTR